MKDQFGRDIIYMRLSVTERCNLRCVYCKPDGVCLKQKELPPKELVRIAQAFAQLGGKKIRVTGGEPLMRRDLEQIIAGIAGLGVYDDICMTTNGHGLRESLPGLKKAGLKRLNISLDSLKPEKYAKLTGGGQLSEVLRGVEVAIGLGMLPVKINAVLVRGENDNEVDDFIALTRDMPVEMRFIELMPIGDYGLQNGKRLPSGDIIARRPYLIPLERTGAPSADYAIEGHKGKVGFISAVSHRFCDRCNRIRVTSDGRLRSCLGNNSEVSLLPALESGGDALRGAMKDAIYNKCLQHEFEHGFESARSMDRIGG